MWSCGCGSRSCGSSCCGSCNCGCDRDCDCGCDSDNGVATAQFPVYVSYPAFFAGDSAINDANIALFTANGNGSDSCGCGR